MFSRTTPERHGPGLYTPPNHWSLLQGGAMLPKQNPLTCCSTITLGLWRLPPLSAENLTSNHIHSQQRRVTKPCVEEQLLTQPAPSVGPTPVRMVVSRALMAAYIKTTSITLLAATSFGRICHRPGKRNLRCAVSFAAGRWKSIRSEPPMPGYRCSGRHDKNSPCHHKLDLPHFLPQKPQNPVQSSGLLEKKYQPFHFY